MANYFVITGKQASQDAHMAFTAYNRAKALVAEHNGKIDSVDGEKIKATFKSNKAANAFATAFESEYAKASKAYKATKATSSTKKAEPKKATKKTSSSPKKAKGSKKNTLNDFIIANPLCTREEAKAHGFNGTRLGLKELKTKLGVR